MDPRTAMLGGAAIGIFLAILFMLFAHRIGALARVGREPLDNRRFLSLAAAGFVPGFGFLGSVYLAAQPWMLERPSMLAICMAGIAAGGRWAFIALEAAAKPRP